jgi:hypothetical protein
MAITIISTPRVVDPASNPLEYVFSSTNTGQPNFSFLVEVSVQGSVYNTYQVFPENGTSGKFDCMEIVRALSGSPFKFTGGLRYGYNEIYLQLNIRVRERYGTPPVPQGSWTSLTSNVFAFNGALKFAKWLTFDWTKYNLFSTDGAKISTDYPRSEKMYCSLSERFFVGIVNSDQANNLRAIISLYDAGGNFINGATPTDISERMNVFDISPTSIVQEGVGITWTDFDDCEYYDVVFRRQTASPNHNSEVVRVYVDRRCSKYPRTRLHFLNKLGVWDSFAFDRVSQDMTDLTNEHYTRVAGRWDSGSRVYGRENGQLLTVAKQSSDRLTLGSDWMSEELQRWLVETLYESPQVYMEVQRVEDETSPSGSPSGSPSAPDPTFSTIFEPVNIVNAMYERKQRVNSSQIREVIEIKRTYNYVSQLA